ncbi:hypothetical protein [Cellulomonas triticagri]|uniref:Uncharacterized protein n=1 Tax=Cellulomonas triticagri TaxID=2483352 RepID=A0A3M2JLK4_9CELL|nr:hypothetical protein [Cellulomonas triticagri]RMI14024.1 hypothetical protein EBM89_02090 [Cellulomonas triticagri]
MTDDATRTGYAAHGGPPGPDRPERRHPAAPGRARGAGPAAHAAAGLALAGLVVAGVAGAATPAVAAPDGPVVTISGDPLVHTFDTEVPGDAVTGTWTVSTTATHPVPFSGTLRADAPDPLADALAVQYGEVGADGSVSTWHDAGTLAEPVAYAAAVPTATSVSAASPLTIPVRVSLPDPSALVGDPGQPLDVTATFTVTHLDPGAGGTPAVTDPTAPGQAGPGPRGVLAITGPTGWFALLAAALVAAGITTRRRARRSAATLPTPSADIP